MSPLEDITVDEDVFSEPAKVKTRKRQRASKSDIQFEESSDKNVRKMMHREIERQRRQEMTVLYASLRDLLPLEYIKGKRSISDHMHGAVNHIKRTESSIKELQKRRDQLKNQSIAATSYASVNNGIAIRPNCVTVNYSCLDGIEILINCGIKEGSLSRVIMEVLQTEVLDIVSCTSTRLDQRMLYRIHSEINTLAYLDLPQLQERLANVIN